jgi:AcrR family transcriptional regulator
VVEAAYRVFCERGYSAPLTAIAAEAGVSVQSLYATFGTKLTLLREVLQFAVHGDDDPRPPHHREWFAAMAAEPDPEQALVILLEGTQGIYDRLGPLYGVFATSDPEIAALWAHSEQLRYHGLSTAVDVVLAKRPAHVSRTKARDMAFVLLGPDTYQQFVTTRGWTPTTWRQWTARTLTSAWFTR